MVDEVRREIERIQGYISSGRLASCDETNTKATAIEPILRELGWDVADLDEVRREYPVRARPNARPVDYLLFCDDTPKVIVEAKRGNQSLERHQEQLQDYVGFALAERVEIAILTNGAAWWYYLPIRDVSWEQRRVATVEFNQQDSREIAQTLVDLLGKENVRSGAAIQNAERHQVLETLPDVWNRLVSEPDSPLVNLLAERTHRSCVREPERNEVEQFLSSHRQQIQIMSLLTTSAPELDAPPKRKATPVLERSGPRNGRPKAFTFNGAKYEVSSWPDMVVKFCEIVHRDNSERFNKVLDLRGRNGRTYFSRNPNEMQSPKKMSGTDIFVTATGIPSGYRIIEKLIAHFEYNQNNLSYELCMQFSLAGENRMQEWMVTLRKENDLYVVECPAIPGCVSKGRTEEKALGNIRDAITECLADRAEEGLPLSVGI